MGWMDGIWSASEGSLGEWVDPAADSAGEESIHLVERLSGTDWVSAWVRASVWMAVAEVFAAIDSASACSWMVGLIVDWLTESIWVLVSGCTRCTGVSKVIGWAKLSISKACRFWVSSADSNEFCKLGWDSISSSSVRLNKFDASVLVSFSSGCSCWCCRMLKVFEEVAWIWGWIGVWFSIGLIEVLPMTGSTLDCSRLISIGFSSFPFSSFSSTKSVVWGWIFSSTLIGFSTGWAAIAATGSSSLAGSKGDSWIVSPEIGLAVELI